MISADTERRAVSLWQLSFLFHFYMLFNLLQIFVGRAKGSGSRLPASRQREKEQRGRYISVIAKRKEREGRARRA